MKYNKPIKFVIVGGVAAGASAAARARRLSENAEITIVERGQDVSFANCGMPYHVSDEIPDRSRLSLQTPASLEKLLNIRVLTGTEATAINRTAKTLTVKTLSDGTVSEITYDKLLLAPGASPIRPPMEGIGHKNIFTLRTLQDMDAIKARAASAKSALIVGAGFIGLEMAEALLKLGLRVTLVELQKQVLPQMDSEMVKTVEAELVASGCELLTGESVAGFSGEKDSLIAKLASGKTVVSDMVILSIGVKAESRLAREAGLALGVRDTVVTNEWLQTSDPDIYAAGDVAETYDPILGRRVSVPLGGPANRQGRVLADHIFMGDSARPYPGTIGTAIVRVFDTTAAVTGWTEKRLANDKIPFETTTVTAQQHASYFPGATPITMKILWSPKDGRLLGAQAFGPNGVDKRMDVVAAALVGKMTVDDLCHLELSYAPPFGSARDILNIAGFAAQNIRNGLNSATHDLPSGTGTQIVDVRPKALADLRPIPDAINIPLESLRASLSQIDKNRPVVTVCALGKSSYFAFRILNQNGFKAQSLIGGMTLLAPPAVQPTPHNSPNMKNTQNETQSCSSTTTPAPNAITLDATGLCCPGPLIRVKDAAATLAPGQELIVKASDAGFASDLPAFCKASGLEFLGVDKSSGILVGRLRKPHGALQPIASQVASQEKNGMSIVLFSCELDKAMAALVIANGVAAMGGQATIFFTFWGINVLRKETPVTVNGKTFMDKMFGWMMPKGTDAVPLSRMHMGGMGTAMMKWRMASKNLPNLPGLLSEAKRNGVRMVVCSMSLDAMGLKMEELLDGVEIGGVADFVGSANECGKSIFI